MTKADTEVGKRQKGYPAKKQKGKKFHPRQDRVSLENEIIRLEDENRELKTLLEEEKQLRKEINETYQSEKVRIESTKKELAKIQSDFKTARITAITGFIIAIISLAFEFFRTIAT